MLPHACHSLRYLPDPGLIGCYLPCVLHGMTAQKVHGGDFVNHCLKFYLYSCCCACGLVSGPTRQKVRNYYGLPQKPDALGSCDDCLLNTIPYLNCLILCQTANEVKSRNITSPIAPSEFQWCVMTSSTAPPTPQEMTK